MRSPIEIATLPTVIDRMHESLYRAYGVLDLVKDLLKRGTPGDVVLDLITAIEGEPRREAVWGASGLSFVEPFVQTEVPDGN